MSVLIETSPNVLEIIQQPVEVVEVHKNTTVLIGGGSNLWTDGGATTYLTSLTDNFAVGGTDITAALFVNASTGAVSIANAFTLPTTDGANGQALVTNGVGTVSWGNPGGLWTDGGTYTYLTSLTDDLAIGGTNINAKFVVDNTNGGVYMTQDLNSHLELVITNQNVTTNAASQIRLGTDGGNSRIHRTSTAYTTSGFPQDALLVRDDDSIYLMPNNAEALRLNTNQSVTVSNAYTLPTTDGTAGYHLQTDGAGNVTWEDPGGASLWTDGGATTYLTSVTDRVAIGTNSASGMLHVAPAASTIGLVVEGDTTNTENIVEIQDETGVLVSFDSVDATRAVFQDPAGEKVIIDVGDNPQVQVHDNAAGAVIAQIGTQSDQATVGSSTAHPLVFYTNSSDVGRFDANGDFFIGGSTFTSPLAFNSAGPALYLGESASAGTDFAGQGQIWVKNDTPNKLFFTDDAGTDHDLTAGGSGLWTDGGATTYLTSTTDNLAVGGNTGAGDPLFIDVATGNNEINSTLDEATGNEAAFSLNYTVNKATSGDDTGLLINQTDTASPGTSLLIDAQVGGTTQARLDNTASVFLIEKTAASADVAGYGQIWVKDDIPNKLFFTDDAGTDHDLTASGSSEWTDAGTEIYPTETSDYVVVGGTSALGQLTVYPVLSTDAGIVIRGAASQSGDYFQIQNNLGTAQIRAQSTSRFALWATTASSALTIGGDRVVTFSGGNGSISSLNTITTGSSGANDLTINSGGLRVGGDVDGARVNIVPKNTTQKCLALQQFSGGNETIIRVENASGAETMAITINGFTQESATSTLARYRYQHTVAGSNADGEGVGLTLRHENNSGTPTDVCYVDSFFTSLANHRAALRFSVKDDSTAVSTPTERMRIDYRGWVGINNSSPGSQLDIIASAATTIGQRIKLAASPTANAFEINSNAGSGGDLFAIKAQGQVTSSVTLDDATGNEVAHTINYTTNKATSGNDTGLVINQTDTASPGTSLLFDTQVGGTSQAYIDNTGSIYQLEKAAASADVAGYGQLWVKTATPNQLWFTRDDGTEIQLDTSAGSGDMVLADAQTNTGVKSFTDQTLKLLDTAGDHGYVVNAGGNLAADRDVILPLLTTSDTFTMNAFAATLTNKTMGSGTVFSSSPTINDGITFTFNPDATNAGINVGSHTADPSSPVNGDIIYNSTGNEFRFRQNGGWSTLGAGSGASQALDNLVSVAINESLVSDTDITDDLGTGELRWRDIYSSTVNSGTTAADTLILRGRDIDGAAWVDILTITSNNTVTADLNAITTIGGNAILDDTWAGSTSVTTLGTITTGTWQGTIIDQQRGGTGIDTSGVTNGQLLIGNTTGNVFALATLTGTANEIEITNGASSVTIGIPNSPTLVTPTIADFSNATHNHSNAAGGGTIAIADTTGTLAIARGGTGQTTQTAAFDALAPTTTKGDVIVHNGTDNIRIAVGSDTQVLTADSAEASGVKWATPAGGGNVSNTGTPVDNQVAIWTNATTIEGTTSFVFDSLLDAATGNEISLDIAYTVNKATSGNDTGIRVNKTDTASPGTSLLMDLQTGGTSMANIDDVGQLTLDTANGPGFGITRGIALGDGDTVLSEVSDDNLGVYLGGVLRFQYQGGSSRYIATSGATLVDEAPSATNPVLLPDFNDMNSGIGRNATGQVSIICSSTEITRFAVDNITTTSSLDNATGNEVAFNLNYTVNKATSGNDSGLVLNKTDTASPGTSLLLDLQVGGTSQLSVDDTGAVTSGTWAADLAADTVDAITEIAAALKSGTDTTLITGTSGTAGNLLEWDLNGDAVEAQIATDRILGRTTAATGDVEELNISTITEEASPTTGDWILGMIAEGNLRRYDVGNLPGGGGGANTSLSNLTATAINLSLNSDTDVTDDLGTGEIRWRDVYPQTINSGTTAADTLTLRGRDIDGASWVNILTITSNNTVTADLNAITTIGGNAILDDTWTGSTSVTTLGTITTGTWNGTIIDQARGGTGIDTSSVTNGQLLIGNTTGNVFALATLTGTANEVDITNGASSVTIGLVPDVTINTLALTPDAAGEVALDINHTSGATGDLIQAKVNSVEAFVVENDGKTIINKDSTLTDANSWIIVASDAGTTMDLVSSVTASNRAGISLIRSRGSVGSETAVASGDNLGFLAFKGRSTTSTVATGAMIEGKCDGAPGSGTVPSALHFVTGSSSGTRRDRLVIGSDGVSIFQRDTDAASVQQIIFRGGNRATAADGDESYFTFQLEDSAGSQVEFARFTWEANDVTDTTKDGEFRLSVQSNNALTDRLTTNEVGNTLDGSTQFNEDAHFGTIISTSPNNASTIDLGSANHQYIDLSSSTGTVTLTLDAPGGTASGTLIIKQHGTTSRDITWAAGTGITTGRWMITEPTWNGITAGDHIVVSWVYDGTDIYMTATEEEQSTFA